MRALAEQSCDDLLDDKARAAWRQAQDGEFQQWGEAFDVFVVVVGVDARWLTRTLALARAGLLRRRDHSATGTDKAL
jgi:hypothetical protein